MSRPSTQIPLDSDPTDSLLNPKLNISCLDFLLIELVPLAQRITDQLHAREQALVDEFRKSKIFNSNNNSSAQSSSTAPLQQAQAQQAPAGTGTTESVSGRDIRSSGGGVEKDGTVTTSGIGGGGGGVPTLDPETREAVFWRLDDLGYRVGQGLVERFSTTTPRPSTSLEAIKFICKDLWTVLFHKQIDNLKTNHRGIFVLSDARFQPLSRTSVDRRAGSKGGEEAVRRAQAYLYFPCGVIRGALAGLGIEVTVTAETAEIPAATFQIKTKRAKA